MFCKNCGKRIDDNSSFCTWCGSRLSIPEAAVPQAASEQPQAVQPVQSVSAVQTIGTDTECVNAGEKPSDIPEPPEQSVQQSIPVPVPVENRSASEDLAEYLEHSAADMTVRDPLGDNSMELPENPRKYYTGGQLALCLVITGIMAAAAGVFAGLYFSVIL